MAIEKHPHKENYYIVRYSKRHPLTRKPVDRKREAKGLAEARRLERVLILEVEELLKKDVVPSWNEVLQEYLVAGRERGLMSKTLYGCEMTLRAHTSAKWGSRSIDSISTQEIRDLIFGSLSQRAPSHQKYTLKCVRAVFAYAVEAAYIDRNPSPKINFRLGDKIKPVLTEEQARSLLAKAEAVEWDWYYHYAMALYTGMRNGELYALTWDKVDLEQRTILVNCSWNNKDGLKSTKSGDDRRVEIAPPLIPILRKLRLQASETNYVLPRSNKWDKGEQARDLRMFLKGIGLPLIRFHDLRATWATLLLSKGVEPIKVMKMGGWKDIETMMIYARKAGVDIKGATDVLNLQEVPGATVLSMAEAR